jgi:hypothetical protein
MPSLLVTPPLDGITDERRAMSAVAGDGHVLFTARRVEYDRWSRCLCGEPVRVVSERAIVAGHTMPQWTVVARTCSTGCGAAPGRQPSSFAAGSTPRTISATSSA